MPVFLDPRQLTPYYCEPATNCHLLIFTIMSTSTASPEEEVAWRKQLKEEYHKMVSLNNSSISAPDKLDKLKQFAETLRQELACKLEENKDLWLSKKILHDLNEEKKRSIEEYQDVIDEMNKLVEEEENEKEERQRKDND